MRQILTEMRLNQLKSDSNIIKLLINVENDPEILAIVVFGSFLSQISFRDIDICLISFEDKINPKLELRYRVLLPEKYDIRFFCNLPLYIQYEIIETGSILLNKHYDRLFDIYYNKIKEFNLFSPHFNTFLEALKDEP
ncbi:MAG: nucleotidyltransferase domain-containing protein [Candidatus Lokiarchaeota archaeon]|nr:nucleotidyltransferase domain-containing protein [Candidatus Harpocratesius repetitus]